MEEFYLRTKLGKDWIKIRVIWSKNIKYLKKLHSFNHCFFGLCCGLKKIANYQETSGLKNTYSLRVGARWIDENDN